MRAGSVPFVGERCFTLGSAVEIMRYGGVRIAVMLKEKLMKKFGITIFGQNKKGKGMFAGIIGAVAGGVFGFFVGRYFSKMGGMCPLLCNPKISTIYFALIGFLLSYKKF